MKGINMMHGYGGKVTGMVIAIAGLITLAIQKITSFVVIEKFTSDQHFNLLLWVTTMGLMTMAFSKEKHEDERVHMIRSKSFMTVLAFMMVLTLTFGLGVSLMSSVPEYKNGVTLTHADIIEAGRVLLFYPAVTLVLHLVMFHIGLYYDNNWSYENETWSLKTVIKNWRIVIATAIAVYFIIRIISKIMGLD